MDRERFEEIVAQAAEALPEEFLVHLDDVVITVEDIPTLEQAEAGDGELLGLYEGTPLTQRSGYYVARLPDRITLFQKSIESYCGGNNRRIARVIGETLRHEIAHHFGIGDDCLDEMGR
jgi:predicted Zn-dependent protease with MMP-like domain